MPPLGASQRALRFGDFEADFRSKELRKNGIRVKLQTQPFQVLQALLERAGEVVSREELRKTIWPEHTFVDFNQGLNNAIKKLREALADDAERPRFIQTLAKRGYRFIGSTQDGRNDFIATGERDTPTKEFAEDREDQRNRSERPIGPIQVGEFMPSERSSAASGEFSRGVVTGVLISAVVVAAFLLHSYSRQVGQLLVELGLRLEGEPTTLAMKAAPESPPVSVLKTNPLERGPSAIPDQISIATSIPFLPLRQPYLRSAGAVSEPRGAELVSVVSDTEGSPEYLLSAFPFEDDLKSLVESNEVLQPEEVNDDIRDTRGYVPPYVNSTAGKYFDVAKYRDELRANEVMGELAKTGFYGTIVHTRTLWLNSYHILVGPYINEEEIAEARPDLESRGFAPRILPSRSTHVSLPPMTLYGTDLTIRDCIVTWEINSPEATVKFIKGKKIIATVKGKWERPDFVPRYNAVVALDPKRGPQTLVEIQWRYTDKVLVFDGSPFKFYRSSS